MYSFLTVFCVIKWKIKPCPSVNAGLLSSHIHKTFQFNNISFTNKTSKSRDHTFIVMNYCWRVIILQILLALWWQNLTIHRQIEWICWLCDVDRHTCKVTLSMKGGHISIRYVDTKAVYSYALVSLPSSSPIE